ncbi:glycoside hydrolase family 5 protein [Gloeothece verrucosa]|uniref:Glycoside hydrolase family 5 n=1 Tax=Gloeothece verrucosa (strain PCC 7822) TaxID=497965 RepID=E0UD50_GLOV7|nr:glycoside hydrolase family 5 protein [Gloeothece verrucosa]ADN12930.1 glycoside hydrolase family 5 [Gloeothece verrucosa PCC 7822]
MTFLNQNNPNFQVLETKIYTPDGQEFIIKGTNMFAWEGTSNVNSYLNNWGFNTIRVPNYLLGTYNQPNPALNKYASDHRIVDAFTSQRAVVIFDAHDRIGCYYTGNDFEILKNYWRDMAREFGNNPYVWFNLQNEPGNGWANPSQWVSYHRELIDIIRSQGANNLIIVDGEAWGQDYRTQTIPNHALEIMEGNENILFSIHAYDQWNGQNIGQYFDILHNQGIPIMVGEYGSENAGRNTLDATRRMMEAVQQREIGRIVWVAKANDANDLTYGPGGNAEYFNGTNSEILTSLGNIVWTDLQRREDLEQYSGGFITSFSETGTENIFALNSPQSNIKNAFNDSQLLVEDLKNDNLMGNNDINHFVIAPNFQVNTNGGFEDNQNQNIIQLLDPIKLGILDNSSEISNYRDNIFNNYLIEPQLINHTNINFLASTKFFLAKLRFNLL